MRKAKNEHAGKGLMATEIENPAYIDIASHLGHITSSPYIFMPSAGVKSSHAFIDISRVFLLLLFFFKKIEIS
jgi:hypothetical protein